MITPFRIAMVGPQPPERSGIAEYSAGLVAMLRDLGLRVDTITSAEVERDGVKGVVDNLLKADAVVYQMGNHPTFHGWMLPLMARVPGVVHLHDLVLHHMVAGVLNEEQRLTGDEYAGVLGKWHTVSEVKSAGLALRCGAPIWNRDDVVHFPLHQVATKFATEVVVHSQYAADRITHEFPWLPVTVVPQLYPVVASHRARERLGTIALMGGGQMNRRFDWVVQALVAIAGDLDQPLTLEIAGEVEPAVLQVLEGLAGIENVKLVNHGHVSDDEFWRVFERADLMIALRQPTMGEASAVVSKAMQAGLPTIVSDQGWYAELPTCVKKIAPTDECPTVLATLLRQLALDPAAFAHWSDACADEAGRPALDPFAAAERYARLLRSHRVLGDFRDHVASAVASLKIDIDSPLSSELQRIDVRTSLRGDRWVKPALAALGDQELDSHARIVGGTVGPYPYNEPLPDTGFQGQATVLEHDAGVVPPSSMLSLRVELTNDGDCQWISPLGHAMRPYGIYLGHFWSPADSTQPQAEQPRTWIEEAVDRSSSGIHTMTVRTPDVPGEYHLEIDLVQESVCWFKSRGFIPARLVVRVEAAQP